MRSGDLLVRAAPLRLPRRFAWHGARESRDVSPSRRQKSRGRPADAAPATWVVTSARSSGGPLSASPEAVARRRAETPGPLPPHRSPLNLDDARVRERISKMAQPRQRRHLHPLSPETRALARTSVMHSSPGAALEEYRKISTLLATLSHDSWSDDYNEHFNSPVIESQVRMAANLFSLVPEHNKDVRVPVGKAQSALYLEVLSKILLRHSPKHRGTSQTSQYENVVMDLMRRLVCAIFPESHLYQSASGKRTKRIIYFNPNGTLNGEALVRWKASKELPPSPEAIEDREEKNQAPFR